MNDEATDHPALETVIIYTEQMESLAQFYADGLGIGPYEQMPRHLGCRFGGLYFGFDQVDSVEGRAPAGVTLWFTVDDLEATYARLVAIGADVHFPPTHKPWGAYLAAVLDPDGNILGLSQRM